ncbi:MAG TPA: pentapeptide repeat-containing protein [Solirubrobacterales bacterium]|nr:pentapeptide repeat-containing protein [Solirubrobacterales bacterium]
MSNPGHLKKFGEGVDRWNYWRRGSPGIKPDLREANLTAQQSSAGADLRRTRLDGADLTRVDLHDADLRAASLTKARLVDVDLRGADLRGADLTGAVVDGVRYDRRMRCLGTRVDLCTGSPRFIRHVLETDYIESFTAEHRFMSLVWGLTSRHSRSFVRAALVAVVIVLTFSLVYWLAPGMLHWSNLSEADLPWLKSLYYSASMFTTVGTNTISPQATSGEFVTLVEVILGYIWLGYLVSILAQRATARF